MTNGSRMDIRGSKSRGVVTVFRPVDMATNPTHHQYSQCDVVDRRYSFKRVRQYRRRLEQTSVQTKMAWSIPALMAGLEESCPKFKAELDWHHSRSNYYVYIYIYKTQKHDLYRCLSHFITIFTFYIILQQNYIETHTHTQDASSQRPRCAGIAIPRWWWEPSFDPWRMNWSDGEWSSA